MKKMLPAGQETLYGLPVLVVDDNTTNRCVLKEMLTQWRMKPTTVDSAGAALSAMERAVNAGKPFTVMFLDAQMPEMDGFVIARQVRKNPRFAKIKIIMLSSIGQRGDAAKCGELEIDGYLPKPVKQSDLIDTIAMVMDKSLPDTAEKSPTLVTRHTLRENRRQLKILLAEDNPVNQKLAVRLLQKQGYTVMVANNGKEAVTALEKETFDLVLMDLQMPEMDGLEATAVIREKEKGTQKHIPVIAMTAHAMKSDQERCLKGGMDGYTTKPIDTKKLFEVIERIPTVSAETV